MSFTKAILPLFATTGIVLLGTLVFATRNVVLELVSLRLAGHLSAYSKSNPQLLDMHLSDPHRRFSDSRQNSDIPRHEFLSTDNVQVPRNSIDALLSTNQPPMLRPFSSRYIESNDRHSGYHALDLANTLDASKAVTINVSRTGNYPNLTLQAAHNSSPSEIDASKVHVIEVTRKIFLFQLGYAVVAIILNSSLFAAIFSALEDWTFLDGLYFSFCALSSIGFGDQNLQHALSKSLFIWHVVLGVVSLTYFSSMIAERALDLWTVEVGRIENRVSRYEAKATLKKMYHTESGLAYSSTAGQSIQCLEECIIDSSKEETDVFDVDHSNQIAIPAATPSNYNHTPSFSYERHNILSYNDVTLTRPPKLRHASETVPLPSASGSHP